MLDIDMPGVNRLELMQRMKDENFDVEINFLTGRGTINCAALTEKLVESELFGHQKGSLRRMGCHSERRVKVRLIAATDRDLCDEVKAGSFQEDVFYRINVLTLDLPPLRDREGDIELLVRHFLPRDWTIDDATHAVMKRYQWSGNVRQLINVIERATILADDNEITVDDLPREIAELDLHKPDDEDGNDDSFHANAIENSPPDTTTEDAS